jgi:Flp pilus assembly CpaF family ATPase
MEGINININKKGSKKMANLLANTIRCLLDVFIVKEPS